jgi:hypothetical protein
MENDEEIAMLTESARPKKYTSDGDGEKDTSGVSSDDTADETAKISKEIAEKISVASRNAAFSSALADVLAQINALQTLDENAVRAIVEQVLEQRISLQTKEIPPGSACAWG